MLRRVSLLLILLFAVSLPVWAQVATSVRIVKPSPDSGLGFVVVTVNRKDRIVAQNSARAWLIEGGRAAVYTGTDGAGGFENEGQSLWRYDVASGKKRKLVSETYVISKVIETCSKSGRTTLLLTMNDGGLGATHVAVVDPQRGEVWRRPTAIISGIRNGRVAVADYSADDFARNRLSKPRQMLYLDLDSLLNRQASPDKPVLSVS
jgi:hypothetical protein